MRQIFRHALEGSDGSKVKGSSLGLCVVGSTLNGSMLGAREGTDVGDPVGSVDKGSMLGADVGCNNVKRRCRMYHVSV